MDPAIEPAVAVTVRADAVSIAAIMAVISLVACDVWVASDFTYAATTAKPFPAAPARAASIVAFRASTLVCLAMA